MTEEVDVDPAGSADYEPADVGQLGWVTEPQRAQLEAFAGSNWVAWLSEELDRRRWDWRSATADDLSAWLDEQLPTMLAGNDELSWLSESQVAQVDALATKRGDPHEWLVAALDGWWPQWREASVDARVQGLDQLLPSLVPVQELGWVSPDQQAWIASVVPGDWRAWLTAQLDSAWPDWAQATPDVLQPWLGQALPSLLAAPPEAATASNEARPPQVPVSGDQSTQLPKSTQDFVQKIDEIMSTFE
ncbi:MAG TPA: hypothetical protein VG708_14870 [Mycobacteriales bacterium]|jgi:hypothetical protein|nr:hypothetical protein [Mycobacteriales bacterium]